MRLLIASVVVAVFGLPQPTPAQSSQQPGLVTDRPDFTESSEAIRRGGFQLETGMVLETDGRASDRSRAFTAPSALLRIGLGHRIEFRLGADGWLIEEVAGLRSSGRSDMEIGAKMRLFDQARLGIDLAVLPILSLPVGADAFSTGGYDPAIKILWAREMPAGFAATGNFNLAAVSDASGHFDQAAVSLSVGHDLSNGWGSYVEIYGFSRVERTGGRAMTIDGGLTKATGDRMQFDVEVGRGITAAAPNWFVGIGVAIRGSFGR